MLNLRRLFSTSPAIRVRWEISSDGIMLRFFNKLSIKPLTTSDLLRPELRKLWPKMLFDLLIAHSYSQNSTTLPVTLSQARQLYVLLTKANQNFTLEADAINKLKTVPIPAKFAIRWQLDPKTANLKHQIVNADRALGDNWYQKGDEIWQIPPLPNKLKNAVQAFWMVSGDISNAVLFNFLTEILPVMQTGGWPVSCDLQLVPDGAVRVEIVKLLDRSLDLRLISTIPDLLPNLQVVSGLWSHLLSGHYLLPFLGTMLDEKKLKAAQNGEVIRLTGNILPQLITVLHQHPNWYAADLATLDARYPIQTLTAIAPTWQVKTEPINGIATYRVLTSWKIGAEHYDHKQIKSKINANTQFMRTDPGWVEFTPEFARAVEETSSDFVLSADEVLRRRSSQIAEADLIEQNLPALLPLPADRGRNDEWVTKLIDQTLRQGIPGGFGGLNNTTRFNVLVEICRKLLAAPTLTRIIWVPPTIQTTETFNQLVDAGLNVQDGIPYSIYSNATRSSIYILGRNYYGRNYWKTSPDQLIVFVLFEADAWAINPKYESTISELSNVPRHTSLMTLRQPLAKYDVVEQTHLLRLLQVSPLAAETFKKYCWLDFAAEKVPPKPKKPEAPTLINKTITLRNNYGAESPSPRYPIPEPIARDSFGPGLRFLDNLDVNDPESAAFLRMFNLRDPKPAPSVVQTVQSFVSQAQQWGNRVEPPTAPIAYTASQIGYSFMSDAQTRWYFYWRSELRKGNLLPVDVPYLYLWLYEVINGIGAANPGDIYPQMRQVWIHYHETYPQMNDTWIDWIADYAAMHHLTPSALNWYGEVVEIGFFHPDVYVSLAAWLSLKRPTEQLPIELLYELAVYEPTASPFYRENSEKYKLDEAFLKSVAAIENYLQQNGNAGLLADFLRQYPADLTRKPFLNALYSAQHKPILIAHLWPEEHSSKSQYAVNELLTAVIKYTENIMRVRAKARGKLHVDELPDGWTAIIDKTHTLNRRAEIDMDKVAQLTRESHAVRAMLIVEDEAESPTSVPESIQPVPPPPTIPVVPKTADYAALPENWARFAQQLNASQWQLLVQIEQGASSTALSTLASSTHIMLSVLIETVNETALDHIGDLVIDANQNPPNLIEDTADGLRQLLAWARRQPGLLG
jgi:hypothetical protein